MQIAPAGRHADGALERSVRMTSRSTRPETPGRPTTHHRTRPPTRGRVDGLVLSAPVGTTVDVSQPASRDSRS